MARRIETEHDAAVAVRERVSAFFAGPMGDLGTNEPLPEIDM